MRVSVIGIDPAAGKGTTVFDGKNFKFFFSADELKRYISKLPKPSLLCWDAPLTAYQGNPEVTTLTKRFIEYYFTRKTNGGISEEMQRYPGAKISGYAGLSHWTISQYILGFPKFNKSTAGKEGIKLIFDDSELDEYAINVTEVHPAIALAFWCDTLPTYKGRRESVRYIASELKKIDGILNRHIEKVTSVEDLQGKLDLDDKLDAFTAWVLGKKWLKKSGKVKCYGNLSRGSFLLPEHELMTDFEDFRLN